MASHRPLKFTVKPHIVEDLGVNLYTTLARVIVEFVANAYDADSPDVEIVFDAEKMASARTEVRKQWKAEMDAAREEGGGAEERVIALEDRILPENISITITDHGHGMSVNDLENKFLAVGRRRRIDEDTFRTEDKKRFLMGRKGLGKLAGFGVAHRVEIISKVKGEDTATKIVLELDNLLRQAGKAEVDVPTEVLENGSELLGESGTRVTLSHLVWEATKNREATIRGRIGDHFALIDPEDFEITMNEEAVAPEEREFSFAYPKPETDATELIDATYKTEDGREVPYKYRIRFTGKGKQLPASDRGVRVYAHRRLAAAPNLLDLRTGIHGFQNTHYMDGVVEANFIDEQTTDYIATDRHSLRWETPFLVPLRDQLTLDMEKALLAYQREKDDKAKNEVREDEYTKQVIESADLPRYRQKTAWKIAVALAKADADQIGGEFYKTTLSTVIGGLGQGEIMTSIAKLAAEDKPELVDVVRELTRLTAREFDDFSKFAQARINGILALQKLIDEADFAQPNNEESLQRLLEKCPWLINPMFFEFLSANRTERSIHKKLGEELQIGPNVPAGYDSTVEDETKAGGSNKRPDLTFLLSSRSLQRLVIVELKAPNTPLHLDHLLQLQGYMMRAEKWLKSHAGGMAYRVEGYLIGRRAEIDDHHDKVESLEYAIDKKGSKDDWQVIDLHELLDLTLDAHRELMEVHDRIENEVSLEAE